MDLPPYADAPSDLRLAVEEFFPETEWNNATNISYLESKWNAFAAADTRDPKHPCGAVIRTVGGVAISAEFSIGYFQIDTCNFPGWNPAHFYNVRHNVGTAHMLWSERGWQPWFFSARVLGLI
jgi:hypothetical protein